MSFEEQRMRRIRVVENSLLKAADAGISIDYENLIREVNLRFGTSRRTSMDYIDMAMKFGWRIVKVNGTKELIKDSIKYDQILNKNSKEWNNLTQKDKSSILEA